MGTPLQCQSDDFRLNDYDIKNKRTSHLSSWSAKINKTFFVVLHQMVLMESRAPLRKIALWPCGALWWELRDRFEPVIAEAVRSKASDGYSIRPLRDDQLESFKL